MVENCSSIPPNRGDRIIGEAFPKEHIEVFAGDDVLQLDNFRKLKGYGWTNFKKMNFMRQDKIRRNALLPLRILTQRMGTRVKNENSYAIKLLLY